MGKKTSSIVRGFMLSEHDELCYFCELDDCVQSEGAATVTNLKKCLWSMSVFTPEDWKNNPKGKRKENSDWQKIKDEVPDGFLNTRQAEEKYGITSAVLRKWCEIGKVNCELRKSEGGRKAFIIKDDDMLRSMVEEYHPSGWGIKRTREINGKQGKTPVIKSVT